MNTYLHALEPDCFRLLQFIDSSTDGTAQPPVCSISNYTLKDCPPYVALSYAWNDTNAIPTTNNGVQNHAHINGQLVKVTPNLFFALGHLSSHLDERGVTHFWIDAICIDQSSDVERSQQVSIMDQICHKAASVRIWLGPDLQAEAYSVREMFRAFLQRFYHEDDCTNGSMITKKYKLDFLNQDYERDLLGAGLPSLQSPFWKMAIRFWDRSWFSRVWVKQEAALARQTSFWCGDVEFTQRELAETSRFFGLSGLSASLLTLRIEDQGVERNSVQARSIGDSAKRIPSLQARVAGRETGEAEDVRQIANRLTGPANHTSPSKKVHQLLRLFAVEIFLIFRDNCSDPRDRIFALLIIFRHIAKVRDIEPLPLQIDYAKTVTEVFAETVTWIINQTKWLGIMAFIHAQRQPSCNGNGLPSWVPDLSASTGHIMSLFESAMEKRIDDSFATINQNIQPLVSGPSLFVSVKRIGVIREVGDSYDDYMERGMFEATARLLLNVPEKVRPDYSRVDYWTDTMDCHLNPSFPYDQERRPRLRHWLMHTIILNMMQEYRAARIARGREFLLRMPSFEVLAQADTTKTLPTMQDWMGVCSQVGKLNGILERRPVFKFHDLPTRRLFRLTNLGYDHCPSATLLGLGPETCVQGDEVFTVAGSAMPLVLRRADSGASHSPIKARVVGEAFVTLLPQLVGRMEKQLFQRWELI